jgi:hypothetical protein
VIPTEKLAMAVAELKCSGHDVAIEITYLRQSEMPGGKVRTEAIAGWIKMKGRNPCGTVRWQTEWRGQRRGANRRPGSVVGGKQHHTALGSRDVTGGGKLEDEVEGKRIHRREGMRTG